VPLIPAFPNYRYTTGSETPVQIAAAIVSADGGSVFVEAPDDVKKEFAHILGDNLDDGIIL